MRGCERAGHREAAHDVVRLGHVHVRLMDEGTNVCPCAGLRGAGLRVDIRRGSKQPESRAQVYLYESETRARDRSVFGGFLTRNRFDAESGEQIY